MKIPVKNTLFLIILGFIALTLPHLHAYNTEAIRPAPTRPPMGADVVVEAIETLEDCDPQKVCVEGQLYNAGAQAANNVRIRVEIGGTRTSAPRTSYMLNVEKATMDAGERQDFSLELDRKTPYKDNGKMKVIEVGRYNFKLVPIWGDEEKPKQHPRRKKKPSTESSTE